MADKTLTTLQTGWLEKVGSSSYKFQHTAEGDQDNDGDMPLNDDRGEYGTNKSNHPIMIFDSSDFTGTTAAEVSSATLTTTISKTHTTNLPSKCVVHVWQTVNDVAYTLPIADNTDIYDGSVEAIDGVLRQGHNFVGHSASTTDADGQYSYGGFTVHDLSSQDWSIGQTLTFDITNQLKAYFRNPHRVNNGQLVITLDFDNFSGSHSQDGFSNCVHLHGYNGSAPPTISMTYEEKSRTRIVLPTSALGSDFVWHGGNWRSNGSIKTTTTVNGVAYQTIIANKVVDSSNFPLYESLGFCIFPITDEVSKGETVDAAILSMTARGQTGWYGPNNLGRAAKVYGDKSDTTAYPTSHADLESKTWTTEFVYDLQGFQADEYVGNSRGAYQLDVTDIVNEILANGSWNEAAIQFIFKSTYSSSTYSRYYPYYQPGGGGSVEVPVLSFLRAGGGGGGGGGGSSSTHIQRTLTGVG